MKVYLAGPMTGVPEYNFPAFHSLAEILRSRGHEVFSPAELKIWDGTETIDTGVTSAKLRTIVNANLRFLVNEAEAIYMLPGWEKSTGAQTEWWVAKTLGLKIFYWGSI